MNRNNLPGMDKELNNKEMALLELGLSKICGYYGLEEISAMTIIKQRIYLMKTKCWSKIQNFKNNVEI